MKKYANKALFVLGVVVLTIAVAAVAPQALVVVPFLPFVTGATTTTTNLTEAMKIIFNEPMYNNVVTDAELQGLIEEDNNVQVEETTGGRYIETAQYFQLPAGVGARAESDYIPVPGAPNVKNARVYLKKVQGVVEMTGDTMRRVKSDRGAFLNWSERALPDLVTRLVNEVDRMWLGYGAGIKARVNDASPDTTLQIDSALGIAGYEDPFLQFLEGESVVFSANANGSPLRSAGSNQSAVINSITQSPTATILTIDALPTGVAQDDYIFAGDDAGASVQNSGVDREFMGLLGMVDDGTVLSTFQNLLRSSYLLWNSIVIAGGTDPFTGSLTEDLLVYADDQTYILGGGKVDKIVTSRSGARSYWKSLKGDRSFNDPRGYTGGKGPLSVLLGDRDVGIKVARKMPPQLAFGLQLDTFKRWTLGMWEWDDTTGAIWNRVTDGTGRKDAFYGVGNLYQQNGCLAPRKNFRIQGLTRVS
jgi:hypothetical protein